MKTAMEVVVRSGEEELAAIRQESVSYFDQKSSPHSLIPRRIKDLSLKRKTDKLPKTFNFLILPAPALF